MLIVILAMPALQTSFRQSCI